MLGETLWSDFEIYQNAKALIFPAEDEEFGIVPVESMGYGTPVIAYHSGGMIETIVDGKTGIFFDELTVESLVKAIRHYNTIYIHSEKDMRKSCKDRAKKFSNEVFEKRMRGFIKRHVLTHVNILLKQELLHQRNSS